MHTLHARSEQSRFAAIAVLARSVIDAPLGPQGVPCVYAQVERIEGQMALVTKTRNESQDTRLVLADKDPQLVQASLSYLTERLKAIGMMVVGTEDQLGRAH